MSVATCWLEAADGRRWPMAGTATLGRSTTNDIVIEDGRVSRRHALVHQQDDAEYWLIDLGSGNGTYLNGRRVTQPTRLGDRDTLSIGDYSFSFRQISGRPISEPRAVSSAQTIINFKSAACWLLIADIKGSTALAARLSATEMAMTVGRWMAQCKEIVDTHGGAINKFLGDGFFAYWRAHAQSGDQVLAALRALQALQVEGHGPAFRLVAHYGDVSFGGAGSLGEDSLSGLDVVIAFRMEKIAGELGCDLMLSEPAHGKLPQGFVVRDLGLHAVPGLQGGTRRFFAAR